MNFDAMLAIATLEMRINIRNRWTMLFAGVFGLLALAISYFGLVTEGYAGFQGFERTTASLLSLVLYLIPLVALMMSLLSLTGDRGAIELLFSQPVRRAEILIAKVLGLFGSMLVATLFGFGVAGAVIALEAGSEGLLRFLSFTVISLLLSLVFLAVGALLSVVGATRIRALGLALLAWFFLVIFYDLLVMGTAFLMKERVANLLIFLSLFGNPVDLARIAGLISVGDVTIFGAAGAALFKFLGSRAACETVLVLALMVWTAAPMAVAAHLLRKRDL
jgi:Cu-processing system permease protein